MQRRVAKVRQQAEPQVFIPVGEIVYFQRFHQVADVAMTDEDRRNGHQGAEFGWNTLREIQSRQPVRLDQQRRQPIDESHTQMAGTHKQQHGRRPTQAVVPSDASNDANRHCGGDDKNRAEIQRERCFPCDLPETRRQRTSHPRRTLQLRQSLVDQKKSDVSAAAVGSVKIPIAARKLYGLAGNFVFRKQTPLCNGFDDVPVLVARAEIHAAIHASGIVAHRLFHDAQRLDERPPVNRIKVAQAFDAIADGDLIDGLLLTLGLHHLLDWR